MFVQHKSEIWSGGSVHVLAPSDINIYSALHFICSVNETMNALDRTSGRTSGRVRHLTLPLAPEPWSVFIVCQACSSSSPDLATCPPKRVHQTCLSSALTRRSTRLTGRVGGRVERSSSALERLWHIQGIKIGEDFAVRRRRSRCPSASNRPISTLRFTETKSTNLKLEIYLDRPPSNQFLSTYSTDLYRDLIIPIFGIQSIGRTSLSGAPKTMSSSTKSTKFNLETYRYKISLRFTLTDPPNTSVCPPIRLIWTRG